MYWRSFWDQRLRESLDKGWNTKSFLTKAPLLATQQIPAPPPSTTALILIFEPSVTKPSTSFSTVKQRWPLSLILSFPSAVRVNSVSLPLMMTRSDTMGCSAGFSGCSISKKLRVKEWKVVFECECECSYLTMTFDSESYLVVGTQVSFVLFYLFLVLYFQFSSLFSHVTHLCWTWIMKKSPIFYVYLILKFNSQFVFDFLLG